MIRIASLTALFVLLLTAPAGAAVSTNQSGWLWGSPEPQGYSLYGLELQGSTGYAAGEFGTLLRTNDGGNGWGTVRTGQSIDYFHMDVIDADSVVLASNCAVRLTDDAGKTFRSLPFTSSERGCSRGVQAVSFPNEDVGYLLLQDGAVLRTDDGGQSFSSRPVPGGGGFITALMFRNATEGLATTAGGDIFRTTNGGSSWTREFDGEAELSGVLFTATQAVAVGTGARFLVSADGGDTWTRPATEPGAPTPPADDFAKVRCASPTVCLVVSRFSGAVYRTTDGGRSFDNTRVSSALAVDYASATRAVTVGFGGATHVSDNGGASFARLGNGIPSDLGLGRVRATSASVAHAANGGGALLRTVDGGETWVNIAPPSNFVPDFWFPTPSDGYALDGRGGVVRTENGGATWSILDPGETSFSQAIFAPDATRVYLIGPRGVLRSTDSGETFERHRDRVIRNRTLQGADQAGSSVVFYGPRVIALSKNDGRSFRKVVRPTRGGEIAYVDFVSARVGYAIERDGRVYFTRNRGNRWTELIAVGYDDGVQLAFGNRQNGWIRLASARPNVLRTSDGGKSWKPQVLGRGSMSDLAAFGSQIGFATNFTGVLFTRDGGDMSGATTLRLSTADRTVPRGDKIKIRGRLSPAEGGEDVEVRVRRLTGRKWREIDVTPNNAGRFTVKRRIRRPTVFVAQWEGDPNSDGDGSRPLVVRVGR